MSQLALLIPIMGMAIPVAAIASGSLKRWIDFKEQELETLRETRGDRLGLDAARTERLEQRVAVLERILTDRSTRLDDEIERLRDRPVN